MMNEGEDRFGLSDEKWQEVKQYYYACVSHVDDEVGKILKTLDEIGQRENTLIIFTSDHGEYLGDHGLVQKWTPGYECIMNVPLVVEWPGGVKASQREELVELVDLAPTILDCCGVQTPPEFQGRSFRGLLEGTDYTPRRSAYFEHKLPFGESWRGVRTHEFRYMASVDGEELLFDRDKDPGELTNVAQDPNYLEALHVMRRELLLRVFEAEDQYPLRTGDY
jgi:arylsulfatase A-like enzyme